MNNNKIWKEFAFNIEVLLTCHIFWQSQTKTNRWKRQSILALDALSMCHYLMHPKILTLIQRIGGFNFQFVGTNHYDEKALTNFVERSV